MSGTRGYTQGDVLLTELRGVRACGRRALVIFSSCVGWGGMEEGRVFAIEGWHSFENADIWC